MLPPVQQTRAPSRPSPQGQLAKESQAQGMACGCHPMSRAVPRHSFWLPGQEGPGGDSLSHPERKEREGDDVILLVSKSLPQTVGEQRLFMNRHETGLATV